MADQHNANIPAMGNTISADIPDIKENLEYHKDVFQAFVNSWSDTTATNIKPKVIGDANNDTLIQCEESSDENIIRFDIGGTEQLTFKDGIVEPTTNNDIDLGNETGPKRFKDVNIAGVIRVAGIAQGTDVTAALHRKIVEIGDWDMDGSSTKAVAHGLTATKIRTVSCIIRNDSNDAFYAVAGSPQSAYLFDAYIINWDATNINFGRATSGTFDSTDFNATTYNRGWVIFEYID